MSVDIRKTAQKLAGRYGQLDVVFNGAGDLTEALEKFDYTVRDTMREPGLEYKLYDACQEVLDHVGMMRAKLRDIDSVIKSASKKR